MYQVHINYKNISTNMSFMTNFVSCLLLLAYYFALITLGWIGWKTTLLKVRLRYDFFSYVICFCAIKNFKPIVLNYRVALYEHMSMKRRFTRHRRLPGVYTPWVLRRFHQITQVLVKGWLVNRCYVSVSVAEPLSTSTLFLKLPLLVRYGR